MRFDVDIYSADANNRIIRNFITIEEAYRKTKLSPSTIRAYLHGDFYPKNGDKWSKELELMYVNIGDNNYQSLGNKDTNWKINPKYPNYLISNMGDIYSIKNGRLLIPTIISVKDVDGVIRRQWYSVGISNNKNHKKTVSVHRLVCSTFDPSFNPNYIVHHINENPFDNRYENLNNISTAEHRKISSENSCYDMVGKKVAEKLGINVCSYDSNGAFVKEYVSIAEAGRSLGKSPYCISRKLDKENEKAHGYMWRTVKLKQIPPFKESSIGNEIPIQIIDIYGKCLKGAKSIKKGADILCVCETTIHKHIKKGDYFKSKVFGDLIKIIKL